MAKDPAFLFYPADFIIGTAFMSHEQVGKYIRILCYQHQLGRMTESQMFDVCGKKDETIYSKFKKDEKGLYFNERIELEKNKRSKYSESRSRNRTKHMSDICKSHDEHMVNVNENINENRNTTKKTNRVKKFVRPTLEEVRNYCIERKSPIDPETFFHNYESTNWIKANGLPVQNWKSTIVTWEKKQKPPDKKEERKKPDPNCKACDGKGELFAQGKSTYVPCGCTKVK